MKNDNQINLLIEKLEKVSGKKVVLKEVTGTYKRGPESFSITPNEEVNLEQILTHIKRYAPSAKLQGNSIICGYYDAVKYFSNNVLNIEI